MAEITIKGIKGNPLNVQVIMTEVFHGVQDGETINEVVDFIPDLSKPVRAFYDCVTARRQYCPLVAVEDNVAYVSESGTMKAGVYTLTIICTGTNGKTRRYKSEPCIEIYDETDAADITVQDPYILNGVFYTSMVQSDWDEVNPASPAYILNKPDLTEYATKEDIETIEGEIPVIPEWAQQPQKPSYTAEDVGAVPTSRTVNGKALSEDITLNAQDVGAQMPIADIAQIREGAAKGATAYQKPSTGIAKSDLTNGIQQSLDRADTALQAAALTPLQNQIDTINNKIPSDATSTNKLADKNYVERLANEKQNTIDDLDAIRKGAAKGDTAYQLPTSGVPKTDLAVGVQQSLNKANTAYQKPSSGIPKTDLAQAVQTILTNADTDHANVATLQGKVSTIEGKIPSAASATNQLVDDESLSEHYAKKDGAYEEMLAGSALNLVDTSGSPVLREFTFDTAGGSDDIGTGSALIKKMRGNTIVWNQKCVKLIFTAQGKAEAVDANTVKYTPFALSNRIILDIGVAGNFMKVSLGKKYLASLVCRVESQNNGKLLNRFYSNDGAKYTATTNGLSANTSFKRYATIITITTAGSLLSQFGLDSNSFGEDAIYVKKNSGQLIDLTQMFGAGNEPSTVEEFEKLFPMPYYDYNEGQLLSFNGDSIKTVGFNQWDEQWELGFLDDNGVKVPDSTSIRSVNYIPILPGTTYYFKNGGSGLIRICWYDANKEFISKDSGVSNDTRITPDNARYCMFYTTTAYGTVYNHDICINLSWSGTKNGTYEPYQEHVHDISFYKTIKDGDGNLLFPNGLLSAGSVYDEVTATKAIKRVGVVDLGTLNWYKATQTVDDVTFIVFYTLDDNEFSATTKPGVYNQKSNVIIPQYAVGLSLGINSTDGLVTFDKQVMVYMNSQLYIRDDSLANNTREEFKAAMSGVMLYYELAEPIEVDFEEQNMAYQVNDYGTEQLLPENTSVPTTTPIMLDVTYGINAVDTIKNLPRNYLAQDDLDRLLSTMGSALGFTYTKTWNETDKQWTFTVTKTATTNDENV